MPRRSLRGVATRTPLSECRRRVPRDRRTRRSSWWLKRRRNEKNPYGYRCGRAAGVSAGEMIRMAAVSQPPSSAVRVHGCGGAASASSARLFFTGSRGRVAASIGRGRRRRRAISCCSSPDADGPRPAAPPTSAAPSDGSIQLYSQIERVITEAAKQSREGWGSTGDWTEVEGAWVLRPKSSQPSFVVHFVGGIFVGAAPQITYRFFLECLANRGALVIATPYASGFDHFFIADEVQFKFDRCLRNLDEPVNDLPTFGVGHSLGSVIHMLIGSRYAVQRSGNVLMSFNNKEASSAIPLFSPVIVPMAQSFGSILSQLTSYPTIRFGAEAAIKQLENLSPPVVKQLLPLLQQLPPLYMDLVQGREDFIPKPEETRRLIKSYYGISRNLLIKFKDDQIDETSTLAQVLSSEAAISSLLDMSIRSLPGDHGLPLQQVLPDVPPAMADAVNRGGELLANLSMGTPWEAVAKEVGTTLGTDSGILRAQISKDVETLVDVIASWISSNSGSRLLRP